jgi:hypothetical protein
MEDSKSCTRCGEVKIASFFGVRRWTNKDGTVVEILKSQCNPCRHQAEKERITATSETRAKYSKQIAQSRRKRIDAMTAEEKEQAREKQRAWGNAWRKANPEKRKTMKLRSRDKDILYKRSRYQENKGELNAKCREYMKEKVENLDDIYVRRVLLRGTGLKPNQLPLALVEAKKLQLKIKRMSYEKR